MNTDEKSVVNNLKDKMRQIMLEKRNSLSPAAIDIRSAEIQRRFTKSDEFNHADVLACYYPIGSEVRTQEIISTALKSNRLVVLPRTEGEHIKFYQIFLNTDLVAGRFGIKEPSISSNSFVPDNIDLLLVPGILFDNSGYRIGYGYGYYDRFIARIKNSAISVGLAYEFQMCEKVPRTYADQKINVLVTEKRMLYF
jgi:5-formyltetrahydrofolate cyclo-ligase